MASPFFVQAVIAFLFITMPILLGNEGMKLNVLIACEESQVECIAFRQLGHRAFSCDLQPCRKSGHPEWHIHGDVTPYVQGQTSFTTMDGRRHRLDHWDLMVSHPPCTYLCKLSSVQLIRHGVVDPDRLAKMEQAREFFMMCLSGKANHVAVENPLPMARANLPKPSCFVQPSWYGHKYTKKTLYWLKNLPPLMAGAEYPNPKSFVNASRGKYRSRTFQGVAEAMAVQWTEFILDESR